MKPLNPHFRLPFRLIGDSFDVLEQDSDEDVMQCVEVVVRTPLGSRVEVPEFGVADGLFRTTVDDEGIRRSVEEWEPRASYDIDHESFGDVIKMRINADIGKEA